MMKNRLYHCFPRRSGKNLHDKGLTILENILKNGLLLTPEVLKWNDRSSRDYYPKNSPSSFTQLQVRVCFTELEESELAAHSRFFGTFAIEWTIKSGRELGFIPVFYIPTSESANGFENHGASLVLRLHEVRLFLDELIGIDEMPSERNEKKLLYRNKEIGCSVSSAKELISAYFDERISLRTLSGFIIGIMHHFYPCDRLGYDDKLGYYKQREWRLAGFLRSRTHQNTSVTEIREEQKDALLDIDGEFFEKQIEFDGTSRRLIDGCGFYKYAFEKHVLEYASRIICPKIVVPRVSQMLESEGIDVNVVPFEDITGEVI